MKKSKKILSIIFSAMLLASCQNPFENDDDDDKTALLLLMAAAKNNSAENSTSSSGKSASSSSSESDSSNSGTGSSSENSSSSDGNSESSSETNESNRNSSSTSETNNSLSNGNDSSSSETNSSDNSSSSDSSSSTSNSGSESGTSESSEDSSSSSKIRKNVPITKYETIDVSVDILEASSNPKHWVNHFVCSNLPGEVLTAAKTKDAEFYLGYKKFSIESWKETNVKNFWRDDAQLVRFENDDLYLTSFKAIEITKEDNNKIYITDDFSDCLRIGHYYLRFVYNGTQYQGYFDISLSSQLLGLIEQWKNDYSKGITSEI